MTFTFERVRERRELEQDHDWWRVYEDSFLPAFRAPTESVLRSLEDPRAFYLRAKLGERTVALATMHLLKNPSAVFLGYIAVSSAMRGRGLGGDLLTVAMRMGNAALRDEGQIPIGMILESEHHDGSAETATERLYRNHGFLPLPVHYEQPPLGERNPVPMQLLFRPEFEGLRLTPRATIAMVQAIYEQEYGPNDHIPEDVLSELLRRAAQKAGVEASVGVRLEKTS